MRKNRTMSGKIMTVALAATFAVSLLAGCNDTQIRWKIERNGYWYR